MSQSELIETIPENREGLKHMLIRGNDTSINASYKSNGMNTSTFEKNSFK